MASRQTIRMSRRAITLTLATGSLATLYPSRTVYAEAPSASGNPATPPQPLRSSRAPIYPSLARPTPSESKQQDSSPSTSSPSDKDVEKKPSPIQTATNTLTSHIRSTRLALYDTSLSLETSLNSLMSSFFSHEAALSSTLSSLLPPASSSERLFPSALYVAIAGMAGSIAVRNRGIFLRGSVPLAVGYGVARAVLPETMERVGDLAWEGEKKVPGVSEVHGFIGGLVRGAGNEVRERTGGWGVTEVKDWASEKVGEGRGWVRGITEGQ